MEDVPFDKAKETTLKDMELCGLKVDKIERIDYWYYFPHVGSKDYADGWYEKVEAMQGTDNTFYAGEVMAFVYALNLVNLKTAQFHIFKSCFLGFVKGNILHTLVVTKLSLIHI